MGSKDKTHFLCHIKTHFFSWSKLDVLARAPQGNDSLLQPVSSDRLALLVGFIFST